MMTDTRKVDATLHSAAAGETLSEAEVKQVRDFLNMTKALGRIGKFLLWAIITAGAIAAASSAGAAGFAFAGEHKQRRQPRHRRHGLSLSLRLPGWQRRLRAIRSHAERWV